MTDKNWREKNQELVAKYTEAKVPVLPANKVPSNEDFPAILPAVGQAEVKLSYISAARKVGN